jgi:ABC-type uncharacterized transport system permease subunit
MSVLVAIAFYLGVVAYSAAATLYFVGLARTPRPEEQVHWAARALAAGAVAHLGHLGMLLVSTDRPVGPMPIALSLSAWITAVAYLVLRNRSRIDAVGVVVSPLALTFLVGAEFVGTHTPSAFPRTLLALHIFANFLGVGLYLLAGAAGAFYLVVERRLKEKRATALQGKLPPLDALDSTEHRLLLAGFPLLTFGIVTGAVFMAQMDHWSGVGVMRAVLAYATWVLVAGVLVLRALWGWRGRRTAYGTLAGVACVLVVIAIYVFQAPAAGALP